MVRNIIKFQYDALSRLTKKTYPDDSAITYIYDDEASKPNCIGKLSKIIDASGSSEFFYDNLGREIKTIKTLVNDGAYTVKREYDSLNRATSLKYPNGEAVKYTYNKSGDIKAICGAANYILNVDYSATGQIKRIEYGNNTHTDYTYDLQTLRLKYLRTNDGKLQDLTYEFDKVGNVKGIIDKVNTAVNTVVNNNEDGLKQSEDGKMEIDEKEKK